VRLPALKIGLQAFIQRLNAGLPSSTFGTLQGTVRPRSVPPLSLGGIAQITSNYSPFDLSSPVLPDGFGYPQTVLQALFVFHSTPFSLLD